MIYRNGEHYYDPTAGSALDHIIRKEQPKRKKNRVKYVKVMESMS